MDDGDCGKSCNEQYCHCDDGNVEESRNQHQQRDEQRHEHTAFPIFPGQVLYFPARWTWHSRGGCCISLECCPYIPIISTISTTCQNTSPFYSDAWIPILWTSFHIMLCHEVFHQFLSFIQTMKGIMPHDTSKYKSAFNTCSCCPTCRGSVT